jgi:dipeptidyl aminopeptidase/acylaminoacyl peptidase
MLSTFQRTRLCLSAALLACAAGALAQTPAPRPPIASFFEKSAFSGAQLSPDAKALAVKYTLKGGRTGLFVLDLITDKPTPVANFDDADIDDVFWVNSNRLVFDTTDKKVGQRDLEYAPGLFAVNRDGKEMRQLADVGWARQTTGSHIQHEKNRLPANTYMMAPRGPQNSNYIYVRSPQWGDADNAGASARYVDLLLLDTVTGRSTVVKRPPEVKGWMLDKDGEPRFAYSWGENKNERSMYMRDKGSDEWRKLSTSKMYGDKDEVFEPLAFAPDGTLYVKTRNGGDTKAIHTYDTQTGTISAEPVIKTPGYDFSGALISNHEKVLGMVFTTDARSTLWFDDKMKALQKRIDDLLPATVNLLSVAARPETPWVLVTSYSDQQPHIFLLFNTENGKFRKVGDAHPAIVPEQMGRQLQINYTARDGMVIPALLTLPVGKRKNLPMVVLIHGGPWVRGSTWGWDNESQFLASRGYAVLEPSFRGTSGLGYKHYEASFKQWGLSMQDDIADGAKWAIDKGYADAGRICLAGASYGGYATLMGLIKDPALFKCGVNWVGVTDIELMYKGHWSFRSDMTPNWINFGATEMIGDLSKDAAQLKATSPLANATKITQPLLLAYGGADVRVPTYHGRKFYDAIKDSNKDVEWVEYKEEGHGWHLTKNNIDFWSRVEKFLDRNIGTPQ